MSSCPNCDREIQQTDIACGECLHVFDPVVVTYSAIDDDAFRRKDGAHFGFPYKNVYATVVDSIGRATFTQSQHKTQLIGIRHFKEQDRLCWIWGERFIFTEREFSANLDRTDQKNAATGYYWFLDKFPYEQRTRIEKLALRRNLDPSTKTSGKPDLAIYSPAGDIEWRFVEFKRGRIGYWIASL